MTPKTSDITLAFLAEGGIGELFDREVKKVAANMRDPNTSPTATRKITLQLTFKPSKDRQSADIAGQTKTTLAPSEPVATRIFLGKRGGEIVAVAFDPGQHPLFEEDADPSVTPINQKKEQQG